MDLTTVSVSGDILGTSRALRSSDLSLQLSHLNFGPNQKSVVTPGAWKIKNSSKIRQAVNKLKSDISKGSNEAIGPDTVLIERVLEKARELGEMLSNEHSLSENDKVGMNLGLLESDLQSALSSLKKMEEDLKDAERKVLFEQDKLDLTKQDLERREGEISAALAKQKRMEDDLNKANLSIASHPRQIKDLKLLVKDQSKKVAISHHALSLKEDELSKRTDDLRKKDEEMEVMNSELESKRLLLDEAREVIRKQEEKLMELQRGFTEKERDRDESLQLMRAEQERLKIKKADLEKQTVEWLSAREELKALAEQASAQVNDVKGTSEDFKRVRALLSKLKLELVSTQKALAASQKNMEEHSLLLEDKAAEHDEHKLLVISYMNSLKDAELEIESERTKLRDAAAWFDEFKSQLSDARILTLHLKEDVYKERVTLEQQTREITSLRKELQQKELDHSDALKRIQAKESELAEARVRIQQMESEQASMQLGVQEKEARVLKAQKALYEVQDDIADLQMLLSNREQQLIQVTMKLRENDDRVFTMRHELDDTEIKHSAAASLMSQPAELSNKLVVSEEDADIGRIRTDQLEEETLLPDMTLKLMETELKMAKDLLREKETDLLAAQRTLVIKEEEKARETEREKMKQEMSDDADGLKKRIGDVSLEDLAMGKLEPEDARSEADAATSAMQKIHDFTRQLVEITQAITRLDEQGAGASAEVAEKEIARLLGLTEELVKEAGITVTADTLA